MSSIFTLSLVISRKSPLLKLAKPELDSLQITDNVYSLPVKIGIVTCSGQVNVTYSIATYETLTLIKSIMISASVHKVTAVDLHIFVDSYALQQFFDTIISEFSFNDIGNRVNMKVYYYNVFKSVPRGSVKEFIKTKLRCTYLRIFFPEVLKSLDEILYLDTDTVVTGNIGDIWRRFHEMAPQKLVALAPNNVAEDENYSYLDKELFGDIPHVPPKGVNAGVFYINLAGLRKFRWTEKVLEFYRKINQSEIYINDQRLLNMFLHDNLDVLEILPCHYNFQNIHCQKGLTCRTAESEPSGIQIFHGTGDSFYVNQSHYQLFWAYTYFQFDEKVEPLVGFLNDLRGYYMSVKNDSTCNGLLGPLLFKNIL
ncbi:unnamed protein product [Orchesella dallaii]|uniref:UDP-D-xylose:beta-D-glucoside alpha-1,3-D-xylosyltransferase n=1 Tax=Orchesella dallaii TaxID=48710 RepID=A0ABP1RGU9_9HEXA